MPSTHHLSPADLQMACGETTFLVRFAHHTQHEAELKAVMMANEIARRILGDEGCQAERLVRTVVVTLERDAVLSSSSSGTALDGINRSMDREEWRIAHAPSPRPPCSSEHWRRVWERPSLPSGIGLVYHPIWDVRRRVLSTYACTITCDDPVSGHFIGFDSLYLPGTSPLLPEIDLFLLDRVLHDIKALRSKGSRVLMACPLHFETLASRYYRGKLADILRKASDSHREDLVFELAGFTSEVPPSRLAELAGLVKPACRSLILRAELDQRTFQAFRRAGIGTLTVDFCRHDGHECEIMSEMNAFAEQGAKEGMVLMARGLVSRSLAVAALGAGFVYVDGEAIHPPVMSPEHVFRFGVEDLFSALLEADASTGDPAADRVESEE